MYSTRVQTITGDKVLLISCIRFSDCDCHYNGQTHYTPIPICCISSNKIMNHKMDFVSTFTNAQMVCMPEMKKLKKCYYTYTTHSTPFVLRKLFFFL